MSDSDLPQEICNFINSYISSVGHLEVVFLLSANPQQTWSAEEVSRELRSNPNYAQTQLKELSQSGLLLFVNGRYQFTQDPSIIKTIYDLKSNYNMKRSTVINFIYSKPLEKIRSLANAFKLKKD